MSVQEALFHCTCTQPFSHTRPPPAEAPLAQYEHHHLSELLFCEDCDAIRCNQCAACEVACYYCPNCLFEVPSASVRGEKNRCARNCFQCPQCDHTLSVVASDPDPSIPLSSAASSVGEPPYLLSCNVCGWDSKQIGMKFEKPTGLALQVQKAEEPLPELLEFDHIKEHIDPFLRRSRAEASGSSAGSSTSPAGPNSVSARLLQDPTGLAAQYGLSGVAASSSSRVRPAAAEARTGVDELPPYTSLYPSRGIGGSRHGHGHETRKGKEPRREEDRVEEEAELLAAMREMTDWETVASVDRRWTSSWTPPVLSRTLRPSRTPLQAKLSKRCPTCLHILIKPEQKSNSVRFKIKLVAANYLPHITIYRRPPASIGSRFSSIGASGAGRRAAGSAFDDSPGDEEPLRPGRTYTYELSFVNPLYEPIHVRLAVARPGAHKLLAEGEPAPPPSFAAQLPTSTFPVAAYAEDWEFEEEAEAEPDADDSIAFAEEGAAGGNGRASPTKRSRRGGGAGIVERRMNRTTVAMDVAIARDAAGLLKASMLVTYVYQADDDVSAAPPATPTKSAQKGGTAHSDVKSFSFWTLLPLGTVVPRSTESRRAASSTS
ncbi:hypothetical protein JCM3774_004638 [Rhodotorula dairenensis]